MLTSLRVIDRPSTLADRVYRTLRDHVCSGRFSGGETLQESALAAQLGVSRTPVREAMGRLVAEGLLESHKRSLTVPALSDADLSDIYQLRILLEPEAVRQVAARGCGSEALLPLRNELAAMRAAHAAGDVNEFMQANYRYRAAWLALVPNQRLLRAIELYANHVRYLRALTLGAPETRAVVVCGLERLADALFESDAQAASKAMREHLMEAVRILHDLLGQQRALSDNQTDGTVAVTRVT